mgnify:CR=1 FL=1
MPPILPPALPPRRRFLSLAGGSALGALGLSAVPEVRLFAQQAHDFMAGPKVPDVPPQRVSEHVWLIHARDGFPTAANQGLMANIVFVVTQRGVVMLDSGCSLQIGDMAIRMIRTVTPQPVVAIFNSHYHGDHWLGNHAFAEAFPGVPIHALAHTREQILGAEGNLWRGLMERADASPVSQSVGSNFRTFVIIIVVLVLLSMLESRCSSCDPKVENCNSSYRSSGGSFGGWSGGGGHK